MATTVVWIYLLSPLAPDHRSEPPVDAIVANSPLSFTRDNTTPAYHAEWQSDGFPLPDDSNCGAGKFLAVHMTYPRHCVFAVCVF